MTLSSSTYHHFELISNNSYRNFFLRQYFLDMINVSHSSLIHSMISNHRLITKLELIKSTRRKRSIPSTPMLTLSSTNCSIIDHNQIQSKFQWSHTIKTLSSVELIYHINSTEIKKSSIPIQILFKHSQTLTEIFSINTYLQYDSIRDFYFINIYNYINKINQQNFIIETRISDQTCQTLHTYILLSLIRSDRSDLQQNSPCKLKTIQIKFEDLGLASLIIRPKEYTYTYCDGSCEHLTLLQSSMHTYLQSIISRKNSNIPQPHCVPSQYADDNFLLRQTDGNMAIYPIKDIIVKQCTCL